MAGINTEALCKQQSVLIKSSEYTYTVESLIGNGSFGVVFLAHRHEDNAVVAIKKVKQDARFKNREAEIMKILQHPNVVTLFECFFKQGKRKGESILYIVMEFIPDPLNKVIRRFDKLDQCMPLIFSKLYTYQLARALNYLHKQGLCHRDVKPQNLLIDQQKGILKLCDFGSAKALLPGEPSTAYICSRYYRAPELVFGSTNYSSKIDIWSLGCIFAELLLGSPLFPANDQVELLVSIINVLGSPTEADIIRMNSQYSTFDFPEVQRADLNTFFEEYPPEALDLFTKILVYDPNNRLSAIEICAHPFFDTLRDESTVLPNGKNLPELFTFTMAELEGVSPELCRRLIPARFRQNYDYSLFGETVA